MRLINEDVLIDGRVENDQVVIAAKCAPTAYDPDNVVEHIKSAKDEDNMVCYINNKPVIEKSKAIEIVKGGGVDA